MTIIIVCNYNIRYHIYIEKELCPSQVLTYHKLIVVDSCRENMLAVSVLPHKAKALLELYCLKLNMTVVERIT